ncbi:MAG: hypothetical protein JW729_07235 [Bacteroidales bacterium]|nr:hypothetical protein [Bacteroidales bacterium]
MLIRKYYLAFILLLSTASSLFAQGFTPPQEGKAVIYFTRVSSYGSAIAFEFFHNDQFIGDFKGKNYLRYECDPGENLFWASSENKEFITTKTEANQTYIVIVDVIIGTWQAHVGLTPISFDEKEKFERAQKIILTKAPIITTESKIEKTQKKLEKFIPEKLKMYHEKWKNERNFKHLSPEMAIPVEALN